MSISSNMGIYVHMPFCTRKCPYCDFYSVKFDSHTADEYIKAVIRCLNSFDGSCDTLYFGGGTPSLMGWERIGEIISSCKDRFGLTNGEITLEANPASITPHELEALRRAGVNRLSIGVQSMHNSELHTLGRLHSAEDARRAVLDAKCVGFDNISCDLMLAIPGQTIDSIKRSIDMLAELPVQHISAYLLSIEPDTPFGHTQLLLPDEDLTAAMYLESASHLAGHGFAQYEISNFARGGADYYSKHNLKYWRGEEYMGIGPAAHSYFGGQRMYFPRDVEKFIASENPASLLIPDGDGGDTEEKLLLALRLCEGCDTEKLDITQKQREDMLQKAETFSRAGLMLINKSVLSLTPEGFLLSNSIIAELLDFL